MQVEPDVRLADGEHVVQFYVSDHDLVRAVGDYLVRASVEGARAIVIATAAHREAFEAQLANAGVDVDGARASGHLLMLDAAETLGRLSADDEVRADLFDDVIGSLVRAAAAGSSVRLFGEMVGLLWSEGDVAGAIKLEGLWNDLAAQVPFSLFCAYRSEGVAGAEQLQALGALCQCHTRLVATAPAEAEGAQRFAPTVHSARAARKFVQATLSEWGLADLVDDASLVVTEMATNALMHVGGDFSLAVRRRGQGVRITVGDSSRVAPAQRQHNDGRPGGLGLRLLDAMTVGWGYEPVDGGKLVWADVDCRQPARHG